LQKKLIKGNRNMINGNLSMHGITKELTLTATHNGNAKNRSGKYVAGMIFSVKLNVRILEAE
jgi:polyisoprenoid-binding protein YceI